MSVTAANILVGVGTFSIDSTDVGSTVDGVTVRKDVELYAKEVDQYMGVLGYAKVSEKYFVETSVAEATLANLKIIWDCPESITEAGDERTLSWGVTSTVTEHTLEFKGVSPEGNDRTFSVYKAVVFEVGDVGFKKDGMTVYPVTFAIVADTSKTAGQRLGNIVDDTSS